MSDLPIPWLELVILIPLIGSILVWKTRDPNQARSRCLWVSGSTLLISSFFEFVLQSKGWSLVNQLVGSKLLEVDEFSEPLLPLTALIFFVTLLATVGHKTKKFSFGWALVGESVTLACLATETPWWLITLLCLAVIPTWMELRSRECSTRIYLIHQGVYVVCLVVGGLLSDFTHISGALTTGTVLLTIAVLVRSGTIPFHCWQVDMFDKASFGSSLLFISPMLGAYTCMRLLLPIAPDWELRLISIVSLLTAIYCSGMALVQTDSRRFYCYLFLSHSSLVLVGLEIATPICLAGALLMWFSVSVALTGFGITMRCIEARIGRVSFDQYYGLYNHMPLMAAFFLLTGLASVGFPCTIGFVAADLLTESAITYSPFIGGFVVLTTMLNGIAVMHAYFRIFTGTKHVTSIPLTSTNEERLAILILSVLIVGGGIFPQPGVVSRYDAAVHLLEFLHKVPTEHHQTP